MRHHGRFSLRAVVACGLAAVPARAAGVQYSPVTDQRLAAAATDDGWLMYRHDYTSSGYSAMDRINAGNVAQLKPIWDYKSFYEQGHESPPVVNGDTMFVTTPKDEVQAFQASTGKPLWTYKHDLSGAGLKTVCCDVVNRGVALHGKNVYMATLDNFVVALDGATGKVVWKKQIAPADMGEAMTLAPLVVKGKVIVGLSGGEYGARGAAVTLDADTGEQAWKRFTIPSPSEPGGSSWPKGAYKTGGGGAWLTGSYDAATDTLLWGVGNPGPWLATLRPGNNLYTNSVIAMNPETGAIKWSYQYTPNDTWDYDGTNETVLTDIHYKGTKHKAIVDRHRGKRERYVADAGGWQGESRHRVAGDACALYRGPSRRTVQRAAADRAAFALECRGALRRTLGSGCHRVRQRDAVAESIRCVAGYPGAKAGTSCRHPLHSSGGMAGDPITRCQCSRAGRGRLLAHAVYPGAGG